MECSSAVSVVCLIPRRDSKRLTVLIVMAGQKTHYIFLICYCGTFQGVLLFLHKLNFFEEINVTLMLFSNNFVY